MSFISGFVAPVPTAGKDGYISHAKKSWPMFRKYGALRMTECWGSDVPGGELTSFPMAVKLEEGETVVLSWIEWPDKATADACWASMETDPDWQQMMDMPFDGKRMFWGGFKTLVEL